MALVLIFFSALTNSSPFCIFFILSIAREAVLFYFSPASPILSVGSRAQHECVARAQPQGRGCVFIYSNHLLISLSTGCRERQASPFAVWLCADSVIYCSKKKKLSYSLKKI